MKSTTLEDEIQYHEDQQDVRACRGRVTKGRSRSRRPLSKKERGGERRPKKAARTHSTRKAQQKKQQRKRNRKQEAVLKAVTSHHLLREVRGVCDPPDQDEFLTCNRKAEMSFYFENMVEVLETVYRRRRVYFYDYNDDHDSSATHYRPGWSPFSYWYPGSESCGSLRGKDYYLEPRSSVTDKELEWLPRIAKDVDERLVYRAYRAQLHDMIQQGVYDCKDELYEQYPKTEQSTELYWDPLPGKEREKQAYNACSRYESMV